jgi:hypothetical protein
LSDTIFCKTHGDSACSFVCSHIRETLDDGAARGFNWSQDEDGEFQATCNHCRSLSDDEWELLAPKEIQLICFGCFKKAALANGIAVEVVH